MKARARAFLSSSAASVRELVGALGALADVGLPSDASEVARFVDDARPRVRAEAVRTASTLGASAPSRAKV